MKIFISGAITSAISREKIFDKLTKERIQFIVNCISDYGLDLFSAHLDENWGKELEKPSVLVKRDLEQILMCDKLIIYLGHIKSAGVLVEMGYAIAFNKDILIIKENNPIQSDFLVGLKEIRKTKEIEWSNDENVKKEIYKFLNL